MVFRKKHLMNEKNTVLMNNYIFRNKLDNFLVIIAFGIVDNLEIVYSF